MLRYRATMLALIFATTSGCQLLRMNPGRLEALTLAAQVGEFRHVNGRWPATTKDLDQSTLLGEFPDVDLGDGTSRSTPPPRRVELQPLGANMMVELYDASQRRICKLHVLAPSPDSGHALIPVVVVKTSVFSCPGEGKWDQ